MRRLVLWVIGGVVLIGLALLISNPTRFSAQSARFAALKPHLTSRADRGIATFAFGDFGALSSETLKTSAAPYKYMIAALALQEAEGDPARLSQVDLAALFRKFGFHSPKTLANWPDSLPAPDLSQPLGLNIGQATHPIWPVSMTLSNSGCAACHSSVTYDAEGQPDTGRVWLGGSNSSINIYAYTTAIFSALRDYGSDHKAIMAAIAQLFPDTSWQERVTLRYAVAPMLSKIIAEREAKTGALLPFRGSLPGATNGLNALEYRLGLIPPDQPVTQSVFNSVPDLGGRVWRSGFLNTNGYTIPGQPPRHEIRASQIDADHLRGLAAIMAYFTVPSMGVSDAVAEAHIGDAADVAAWMQEYRPQPFPGVVDETRLPRGRAVYAAACSQCHGEYDASLSAPKLVSFPNWVGDVGTDPARIALTGAHIADAVNGGDYGAHIAAHPAEGYIAPPLTGLWASAPYLHNGSVPTLWHLMHPKARPVRFVVGGHALDMHKLGLQGVDDGAGGWMPPPDYTPWATTEQIDTTAFGLGHQGHEAEFEALSAADKRDLLEYLKRL